MSPKHKLTLAHAAKLLRNQARIIECSYTTPNDHKWDDNDPETHREHVRHDDMMETAASLELMRNPNWKP